MTRKPIPLHVSNDYASTGAVTPPATTCTTAATESARTAWDDALLLAARTEPADTRTDSPIDDLPALLDTIPVIY